MQFCHASKSLAESVFSSHLFGKRRVTFSVTDIFCRSVHESVPKPLLAGLLSLANTCAGGRIIYAIRVANSADLSDGIVREKGKVCHSDLAIALHNILIRVLVPAFIFQPFSLAARGCSLSVDLVYESGDPRKARLTLIASGKGYREKYPADFSRKYLEQSTVTSDSVPGDCGRHHVKRRRYPGPTASCPTRNLRSRHHFHVTRSQTVPYRVPQLCDPLSGAYPLEQFHNTMR